MNKTQEQQMLPQGLRLQKVERKQSSQAPLELMERIANTHAKEVWGPDVGQGEPLPILDEDGNPLLYAFPFAIGSQEFPNPNALIKRYNKLRQASSTSGADFNKPEAQADQPFPTDIQHKMRQFGTVYVSATMDRFPVQRVSHGLHPYFYNAEPALNKARAKLGLSKSRLTHIRLAPSCHEYFEISGTGKTHRLHVHTLKSVQEIVADAEEHQQDISSQLDKATHTHPERIQQAWEYYKGILSSQLEFVASRLDKTPHPLPLPTTIFRIPHYELVPALVQGYWCEATAMGMVFAFWDHYVPSQGTWKGYSRIVDYWLDHPADGANMPNLIDEVIACSTYEEFANILNEYNWSFSTVVGNSQNDWAWDALVAELHTGRPARWKWFVPSAAHANCAFGYRIASNGGKYVLLYNTWGTSPDECLYNEWAGTQLDHTEVNCYVPGGGEPDNVLYIRRPYGGETYNAGQKNKIAFKAGSDIKLARIEYSADGGHSWSFVVEVAVTPGWNKYFWKFPPTPTTKARIRIQGLSSNRDYLAGDGSFTNFTLQ